MAFASLWLVWNLVRQTRSRRRLLVPSTVPSSSSSSSLQTLLLLQRFRPSSIVAPTATTVTTVMLATFAAAAAAAAAALPSGWLQLRLAMTCRRRCAQASSATSCSPASRCGAPAAALPWTVLTVMLQLLMLARSAWRWRLRHHRRAVLQFPPLPPDDDGGM